MAIGTDHLGSHTIAMHGLKHFTGRNEDILTACIGTKKTEAISVPDEAAGKDQGTLVSSRGVLRGPQVFLF
jgi:hypothetical protein